MNKWYNWLNEVLSSVGIALGINVAETSEILGLILLILNIAVLIVSMTLKIINWVKQSKEDGKITDDEIKDLEKILTDTTTKIDDIRHEKDKDDKNA